MMGVNLLATHIAKIGIHVRGARLVGGVAAIAVGGILTWLVIFQRVE